MSAIGHVLFQWLIGLSAILAGLCGGFAAAVVLGVVLAAVATLLFDPEFEEWRGYIILTCIGGAVLALITIGAWRVGSVILP